MKQIISFITILSMLFCTTGIGTIRAADEKKLNLGRMEASYTNVDATSSASITSDDDTETDEDTSITSAELSLIDGSVTIKVTKAVKNAILIIAGYQAGRLVKVQTRNVSTDSSLEIEENAVGFEDADKVKAFLWGGLDGMRSLCTSREVTIIRDDKTSKILTVYFSRVGNTNYPSDIDATTSASVVVNDNGDLTGTTETIAEMIRSAVGGDIAEIQTASKYSTDFDEVVDKNHEEINDGTIPELLPMNIDISEYDTVFIGYPIWATTIPQAVRSFMRSYDLSGKTVIPFCTHDGYGSGRSYTEIKNECAKSTVLDGLTIPAADIVGKDPAPISERVNSWINRLGIKSDNEKSDITPIKITVGSMVLDGYLNDTPEAEQFKTMLPITVSMVGYGGREYYGGISSRIEDSTEGKLNFENGDITYCPSNNTVAIFYAQTSRPNLTMRVIKMGMVTSDLSVFDGLESNEDITLTHMSPAS